MEKYTHLTSMWGVQTWRDHRNPGHQQGAPLGKTFMAMSLLELVSIAFIPDSPQHLAWRQRRHMRNRECRRKEDWQEG